MKKNMPENSNFELLRTTIETHMAAMDILGRAAVSWKTVDIDEMYKSFDTIKTARDLFYQCGAMDEHMTHIIYAVEFHLLSCIRDLQAEKDKEKRNTGGNVYFLKSEETGLVKIGFSTQQKNRIRSIQASHSEKTSIVGFLPGTKKTESSLHRIFKKDRANGEWFSCSDGLSLFIDRFTSIKPADKYAEAQA